MAKKAVAVGVLTKYDKMGYSDAVKAAAADSKKK